MQQFSRLRWSSQVSVLLGIAVMTSIMSVTAHAQHVKSPEQREIENKARALVREIRKADPISADILIDKLEALGEHAELMYVELLTDELQASLNVLKRVRASEAQRMRGAMEKVKAEREAAWSVIAVLNDSNVPQAREHYDRLIEMDQAVARASRRLTLAIVALGTWDDRYRSLRDVESLDQNPFDNEQTRAIIKSAEEALGVTTSQARPCLDMSLKQGPDDALVNIAWTQVMRDRVQRWHRLMQPLASQPEWTNYDAVNAYRLALGLRPLMADPRLLQAARRHSKEMIELGYFAHESPVEAHRSPGDRMKRAGYPSGGGENIAAGSGSGVSTFFQWFNSPGHHKNMVGKGYAILGVGKWQNHWTQNFAGGSQPQWLDLETIKAIEVQGEIVPPR